MNRNRTDIFDINGKEYKVGDYVNVFFTSDNGEFNHDMKYIVKKGPMGDLQLEFVDLMWENYGNNQYTFSSTLCLRYSTLDVWYIDNKKTLCVPHSNRSNLDFSTYFEIIGSEHE